MAANPTIPASNCPTYEDRNRRQWLEVSTGTLVVIGIALRVWQYLGNASLWLDELAIDYNLESRSLISLLTEPLARQQAAPPGFLLVEKLIVMTFGDTEYVLRLFPFVCGVAALVLFWRLALRLLPPVGAISAIAMFASAIPLLFYGAMIKQYSCDLAASVLLLHVAVDLCDTKMAGRARTRAIVIGAGVVWFSQASVLVLFGLGTVLSVKAWRDGSFGKMWPVIAVWSAASLAAAIVAITAMTPETRAYMHLFWANGFMPLPITNAVRHLWPAGLLSGTFAELLHYRFSRSFALLVLFGFIALLYRNVVAGTLVIAPLAATLLAAAAQQYPFSHRLVLFLLPNIFVAAGAMINLIFDLLCRFSPVAGWAVAISLVGPEVHPTIRFPPVYCIEDCKSLLDSVREEFRSGDRMYVYYGAVSAMLYYGPHFGIPQGSYTIGRCHRAETRQYFRELDEFRGQARTWLIFIHYVTFFREREDILDYLDAIGRQQKAFVIKPPLPFYASMTAEAYLYDLSDPTRLQTTDAASFRVTGPERSDPRFPATPPCTGPGPDAAETANTSPRVTQPKLLKHR